MERSLHITAFAILLMMISGCAGRSIFSDSARSEVGTEAKTPANQIGNVTFSQSEPTPEPAVDKVEMKKNTQVAQNNTRAAAEYHFSMAQAYVAEGNPDRAIEEYRLTLMFDPQSALVYARLATEYIKKGMLTEAMASCKEALRVDPKFTDARLMMAGLYSSTHETQAALNEYDTVLKQDPTHEEAVIYKAQVLSDSGRTQEAASLLTQFVKRNKDTPLAWYYLGRAEQSQDHFEPAVSAFKKAIQLKPAFSQASLALGLYYEERKMNADAKKVYLDLYEESQDLAAANRLATIFLKEEKYAQAIPYLQAIEVQDPDDMNSRVKLGLIYMETKAFAQAEKIFTDIIQKNPESDRVLFYLGGLYEATDQYSRAIGVLKKIRPESKMYQDATLHVAYLLKQTESLDVAKAYMSEVISKHPNVSPFYVFHASLEEEGKNLASAISILEVGRKKFPEDEKILYYIGSLYDRQGNVDRGIEAMESILKVNPENVDALNYIGYTWVTKGIRLADAERALRKALSLKPDNAFIVDSWGWYLYVQGRVSEAIVELERAARMKPNEPTILEHLADAYLRSNLREKAVVKYGDAVKFAEDDTSRQKIENKLLNLRRELAGAPPSSTPDTEPKRMPAGKN